MRSLILKYFDEQYEFFQKEFAAQQIKRLEGLSDKDLLDEYTESIMDRFRGDYD